MPDSIALSPELQTLKLSPKELKNIELVRATAKSISERFNDLTDFVTIIDLRLCLQGAKNEIEATASLIQEKPV